MSRLEPGLRVGEEHQVELLDLPLEHDDSLFDDGHHVGQRRLLQRDRLVGTIADAVRLRQKQRGICCLRIVDRKVEVRAERAREDRVEARAIARVDEAVPQQPRALEGPRVQEPWPRVGEFVAQHADGPLRKIARVKHVVALVVNGELLLDVLIHVHHAGGELPRRVGPSPCWRARALKLEHRLEDGRVYRAERLLVGIVNVAEAHVGREARREREAADCGRWVHRGDDLDALKADKVQVLVVEALVAHELLQEGDQLGRLVLVGLGQVDILEVQHEALRAVGTEHLARLRGRALADLRELVDHVRRERLRRAVDDSDLRRLERREHVVEQHVLARALRSD
eukprot:scaffold5708_cov107-Isochrysis_galbana.AAC.9